MFRRELSSFMSRELLYDYVSGKLDAIREEAVRQAIQTDKTVSQELHAIELAQEYINKLEKIDLVSELPILEIEKVKTKKQIPIRVAKKAWKWTTWPQPVKWGVEALSLTLLIVVTIKIFPWQMVTTYLHDTKMGSLSHLPKNPATPNTVAVGATEGEEEETEVDSVEDEETTALAQQAKKMVQGSSNQNHEIPKQEDTGNTKGSSLPLQATVASKDEKRGAHKGEVYRISIVRVGVDQVAPEIVAKIRELKGDKAGNVPLGWRKPNGSYSHFFMPFDKKAEFEEFLKKYGKFKVIRESHPRVMPEGMFRMILWMEEDHSVGGGKASPQEASDSVDTSADTGGQPSSAQPSTAPSMAPSVPPSNGAPEAAEDPGSSE